MRERWRTNQELAAIYKRQCDTVYRVCMLFFRGRRADAEDAVQSTFLRLMRNPVRFSGPEHEKAWLAVTASNVCKSMLASAWNRRVEIDETAVSGCAANGRDETLPCVMALPDRYKTAVYLFYYEGYSCREIAKAMGKTENSVWGYLHAGRALLRETLKEGC